MITSFAGEYRFLSNFYPSLVELDGRLYPTVEHAFQAAKTRDELKRIEIAAAPTPGKAKRMGRKVALRADWDKVKLEVMANLVRQKFSDPELREKLHDTGSFVLIEGNSWGDTFWGVCDGRGENHLGKILMEVRRENKIFFDVDNDDDMWYDDPAVKDDFRGQGNMRKLKSYELSNTPGPRGKNK